MRLRRRKAAAASSATSAPTERSRRVFARRQWRRRLGRLRYLGLVLVLALLAGVGVWIVWFSSLLAVADVEVHGADMVPEERIRAAARVAEGRPLARIDLDAARNRVAILAPIRDVDVTRRWPDTLVITVVERTPVAVVEIGGRFRALDAEGVVFREFPRAPDDLPLVLPTAGASADALREAAAVVSSLPEEVAILVRHVEVRTVDQISLALRDGRSVVWGSSDDSANKARVLAALLSQDASVYDVSVPGRPTTSGPR